MTNTIITSSLLIGLLALMRRLCRNRISRRLQYALWLLAAIHLLTPAGLFENPFHIMNGLHDAAERIEQRASQIEMSSRQPHSTFRPTAAAAQSSTKGNADTYPKSQITAINSDSVPSIQNSETAPLRKRAGFYKAERLLQNLRYTGMAAMAIWIALVNILGRRRLSRNRILIGREGRVRIYMTENTATPCLVGILFPVIYLTPGSVRAQKHKEYALAHELTHYRHKDQIWNLVRNLCLILYWFHPLVWLGARLSAQDCELACDEGVLRRLDEEQTLEYGCTLIEMAASFRRPWMLSCETALACGKRDLKERLNRIASGRRKTGFLTTALALLCSTLLAFCTLGEAVASPSMGRYIETDVPLPKKPLRKTYLSIVLEGDTVRLIANMGGDVISLDGGATFEKVPETDMPPGTTALPERDTIANAGTPDGARAFQTCAFSQTGKPVSFENFLITENGEEIRLQLPEKSFAHYFYSNGSFFIDETADTVDRYYRLDPDTGEMQLLMEMEWTASYMTADENILYLVNESGILLYDLKTEKLLPEDQVLSDFVRENAVSSDQEWYPALLSPYRDGVYILTHKGLYWHRLYDKEMELVIDGAFCSIGAPYMPFTGMILLETEGKPEFLIQYNREDLMRYTYDASLPTVPQ